MLLSSQPRVRLLHQETPLEALPRLGETLGLPLFCKRDDVMPLGMGGNKVRSLEFWLGEALSQGCDAILVGGLPPSNLCRLTAAACARLGLRCIVVHNADAPGEGEAVNGNALLNRMMGVETLYCGKVDEYARMDCMKAQAEKLRAEGARPYIIGDEAVGALGYVAAALELAAQADRQGAALRHVFISASAGPTETGLLFGLCLLGGVTVHLVSVEYDEETFWRIADDIFGRLTRKLGVTPPRGMRDIARFYGAYLGDGYARPTPGAIESARMLARTEGVFAETVYNAKVVHGLIDLAQKGALPRDEAVCLYHTGGAPALFGQAAQFCGQLEG